MVIKDCAETTDKLQDASSRSLCHRAFRSEYITPVKCFAQSDTSHLRIRAVPGSATWRGHSVELGDSTPHVVIVAYGVRRELS